MVNQGGSWVGFVEGNESFKMVVVASKNSTGVGRNRPWKMGTRGGIYCNHATGGTNKMQLVHKGLSNSFQTNR
ncbi:S2-RNase [Pyrus ussuriensis x Pyrus communis]|uniref:S2-RNase n=1 Tax=Pyrus ussuriensis x Pyrus communis TaxID=2448454 RepID=A0A5N5HJP6_9ROSA|nr:S2-RNase [Pyrus ussuriensis x Pyrus communis]